MKIVVIGDSGLIGSKVVNNLRLRGHEVVGGQRSFAEVARDGYSCAR